MSGWVQGAPFQGAGGGGELTSDNTLTGPDGGGSGLYQRDGTACPVVSGSDPGIFAEWLRSLLFPQFGREPISTLLKRR